MAARALEGASVIAVPLPCLCEFVWVLRRVYGFTTADITGAMRSLLAAKTVQVNRPAAEAGLAALLAGGDFADAVIAHEGRKLGGETFISFDRQAVDLLTEQGFSARLLR